LSLSLSLSRAHICSSLFLVIQQDHTVFTTLLSCLLRMDDTEYGVQIGENKFIRKATVLSHLKTYNLYYEGQNLQLRHREEEGELIVEGLLNIFWGLRRPIRLQMQDDHERIRPPPSSTSWHSGCNLDSQGSPNSTDGQQTTQQSPPTVEVTEPDSQPEDDGVMEEQAEEDSESSAQLLRTKSDAGVLRRGQRRSPSDQRKIRRHRFSINGHFYNHKTSVFTPAFGSMTNVRINSCMRTPQVLRVLLNKFKIENSPDDFALYLVHASGERVKLKRSDYPLVLRVIQGPCEQVCKVFLMEEDLGEEVTYDVAQYIKFEMPVLRSFITKLKEEEDREVQKLRRRYTYLRCIIEKQLSCLPEGPACIVSAANTVRFFDCQKRNILFVSVINSHSTGLFCRSSPSQWPFACCSSPHCYPALKPGAVVVVGVLEVVDLTEVVAIAGAGAVGEARPTDRSRAVAPVQGK
ncbi:hypothetical protein FQN60_018136, partial [Etheostoma spectabile]